MMPTLPPANELPQEVITCLNNAKYLHLATSDGLWPHVSLMNYTYLPSTPYALPPTAGSSPSTYASGPVIIMTTQPSTKKTLNLLSNPRVSLLVHDWVSHRSSVSAANPFASGSPPASLPEPSPPNQPSSLATLLTNLNTAALSSISATLNGYAHLIPQGTEEEEFYKRVHMENNTESGDRCYLDGEEVRVVVVRIGRVRVADFRGRITDWAASGETDEAGDDDDGIGQNGGGVALPQSVNGF